jgi:hypothetical protein
MDRFARGPFRVAYEARADPGELRQNRIANAQCKREEARLDALLAWKDEMSAVAVPSHVFRGARHLLFRGGKVYNSPRRLQHPAALRGMRRNSNG